MLTSKDETKLWLVRLTCRTILLLLSLLLLNLCLLRHFGRTLMSAAQRLPGMRSLDAKETGIQWLDTATQFAGATLGEKDSLWRDIG